MLMAVLSAMVKAMTKLLTPEMKNKVLDAAFDSVEKKIAASKTQIDDIAVLPIINGLRDALDVPDND